MCSFELEKFQAPITTLKISIVKIKTVATLSFLTSSLVCHTVLAQAVKVDPASSYQNASGVFGNFTGFGPDTPNNLMTLWAKTCKRN